MRGNEHAPDLDREELSSAGCSDSREILRKSFSLCSRGAQTLRTCIRAAQVLNRQAALGPRQLAGGGWRGGGERRHL